MSPLQSVKRVITLLSDPRTPRLQRAAVGLALLYLIVPVDLLPDFAFFLGGYLDDFAFLWMTLRWLLRSADAQDRLPPEAPGEDPGRSLKP